MAKKIFLLFFLSHNLFASVALELKCSKFKTIFDIFSSITKEELLSFSLEDLKPQTKNQEIFFKQVTEVITFANRGYVPCANKPYKKLVQSLREALSSNYYQEHALDEKPPKTILLLQKICFALYTQEAIKVPYKEMTEKMGKMGGYNSSHILENPDHIANLESSLSIAENQIKGTALFRESLGRSKKRFHKKDLARIKDSYKGCVLWGGFDPFKSKNIPYHKFTLTRKDNNKVSTQFIRMGTPTINNDHKTIITPEFLGYLHYLKHHKMKHTYINLQDARNMSIIDVQNIKDFLKSIRLNFELYRVKALHSLLLIPELKDTIEVITLSKDSNFYNQTSPFDFSEKKESFIKRYKSILFNSKQGYILPKTWIEPNSSTRIKIENKIERLSEIIFSNKKILNCDDKRFFLELSYALLIDIAAKKSNFINITCKDGIDRAGSVYGFIYFLHKLISTQQTIQTHAQFQEAMKHLHTILFSDALAARKREVIESRFDSFYKASLYLIKFLKKEPEKIKPLHDLLFYTYLSHER